MRKLREPATGSTYVGLDVSLKETSICVLEGEGRLVGEAVVASDPDAIAAAVGALAATPTRVVLETGPTSPWLFRELAARGLPMVCLDGRYAHRVLSLRHHKSDRNDARGLAELARSGLFREAQVRSPRSQFVRSLLAVRMRLVEMRRSLENQMRGIVKVFGIVTTSTKGRPFPQRMRELARDDREMAALLDPLLAAHRAIEEQIKVCGARLSRMARADADVRRMMTVPGVGALTALAFKATIDDPARFSSSAKVGAYLGLAPRMRQSGEASVMVGIGHPAEPLLRAYLFEAATVLMRRIGRSCALKGWGMRLCQRIGFKRAAVAVARKLSALLHAIWTDGTEFEWRAAAA